jgi:hypothetical protein
MPGDVVELHVRTEDELAWWRPLAQAVLAAPHLLWVGALSAVSVGLAVVATACVLAAGRVPRALVAVQVLTLRERVRCYSYWFALRTGYPPMAWRPSIDDPGDDPSVRVSATPADRFRRRDVAGRLVVLGHLVVLVPIGLVMDACYPMWILLAAANRGWPPSFRRLLVCVERWVVALAAYELYITNERPAFGLRAYDDDAVAVSDRGPRPGRWTAAS